MAIKIEYKNARRDMSKSGLDPTFRVIVIDQAGREQKVAIAGESPLTILVDDTEIVTLMTLGTHPEELVLGYLRNQGLIEDIEDVDSVKVDWESETANVITAARKGLKYIKEKLSKRIVTSGCGQGTIFSCSLDKLYEIKLANFKLRQSTIYALLKELTKYNQIYKEVGSVHGCGLCQNSNVLIFIEDVGRHNAADAIGGRMWIDGLTGADKILYTTGRLTSEIVMKAAQMAIPVVLSRSGMTRMGLELAQDLGITLIARAKGKRFFVYHGHENIIFDALPKNTALDS
jgi:FdhD protein